MQSVQTFFHNVAREAGVLWDNFTQFAASIFDPQTGWQPKAIFGACLLLIVFWVSKRGTKS